MYPCPMASGRWLFGNTCITIIVLFGADIDNKLYSILLLFPIPILLSIG